MADTVLRSEPVISTACLALAVRSDSPVPTANTTSGDEDAVPSAPVRRQLDHLANVRPCGTLPSPTAGGDLAAAFTRGERATGWG